MSEDKKRFKDLGISKQTLDSLEKIGYIHPTKIQEKAIPEVLSGKDIVAQAQTGTGKTASFGIPIVEKVNPKEKKVQALILVPTRELAIQVADEIKKIGRNKKIYILAAYGGKSIDRQIHFLRKGNDVIVVGTPGRIKDLIDRGELKLDNLKILVLDEADRMLDMGFLPDIEYIISKTPKNRQTLLFSATMPKEILKLAEKFLKPDYKKISVAPNQVVVDKIKQQAYIVRGKKIQKLEKLLTENLEKKSIIFTQTKKGAEELAQKLKRAGFEVEAIHGDYSQKKRENIMRKFRTDKIKILVATDVASRGLDIKGIDIVYNYDIPKDSESYVHRIGRTARAGKSGKAISLVEPQEGKYLRKIEKETKTKISVKKGE
ncbi:MAG: DEAD/DEAH box helicase [Aquificae bacterium]|nr:DEAD/DEAH box helicase [Aquificota bacterium]